MELKMRELVEITNTPKSTIIYYIQQGLLPKPKKVKMNLHIYDERFINMINFIKYLQENFGASIEQIKNIIQNKNFDFSKGYENLINNLNILMFTSTKKVFNNEELAKEANLSSDEIEKLIDMGVIFDRDGKFIEADLRVAKIVSKLLKLKGGNKLLKEYLKCAEKLSNIETELARESLKNNLDRNQTSKLLLDTALILKPYIFNSKLFKNFQKSVRSSNEKSF